VGLNTLGFTYEKGAHVGGKRRMNERDHSIPFELSRMKKSEKEIT